MAQETWIVAEPTVIELERIASLKVSLIAGQIDIVAHDEPGARVEVHSVSGRDLKIAVEGDRLVIDHPQMRWENFIDTFRLFRGKARAEVSVLVPRSVALSFGVVSASALISGLHADATVSTVSGDVVIDGMVGELQLNTVSGEMDVRGHRGEVRAHTVSGDITVSGEVERFDGDGVSGDVFLDLAGAPDRIETQTVSGDVTVRLDPGVPAQYLISTLTGRLQLDDARITGVRGSYTGRYGALAGRFTEVRSSSVSGDVSVVHAQRPGATAEHDAGSTAAAGSEATA